jgi:hypothetical protein
MEEIYISKGSKRKTVLTGGAVLKRPKNCLLSRENCSTLENHVLGTSEILYSGKYWITLRKLKNAGTTGNTGGHW